MLKISHWLDNRLSDGGETVSLTHRSRSTTRIIFCLSCLARKQGLVKLKKKISYLNDRNYDVPASSIVSETLRYCVPLS
jgi:hypothetical protein